MAIRGCARALVAIAALAASTDAYAVTLRAPGADACDPSVAAALRSPPTHRAFVVNARCVGELTRTGSPWPAAACGKLTQAWVLWLQGQPASAAAEGDGAVSVAQQTVAFCKEYRRSASIDLLSDPLLAEAGRCEASMVAPDAAGETKVREALQKECGEQAVQSMARAAGVSPDQIDPAVPDAVCRDFAAREAEAEGVKLQRASRDICDRLLTQGQGTQGFSATHFAYSCEQLAARMVEQVASAAEARGLCTGAGGAAPAGAARGTPEGVAVSAFCEQFSAAVAAKNPRAQLTRMCGDEAERRLTGGDVAPAAAVDTAAPAPAPESPADTAVLTAEAMDAIDGIQAQCVAHVAQLRRTGLAGAALQKVAVEECLEKHSASPQTCQSFGHAVAYGEGGAACAVAVQRNPLEMSVACVAAARVALDSGIPGGNALVDVAEDVCLNVFKAKLDKKAEEEMQKRIASGCRFFATSLDAAVEKDSSGAATPAVTRDSVEVEDFCGRLTGKHVSNTDAQVVALSHALSAASTATPMAPAATPKAAASNPAAPASTGAKPAAHPAAAKGAESSADAEALKPESKAGPFSALADSFADADNNGKPDMPAPSAPQPAPAPEQAMGIATVAAPAKVTGALKPAVVLPKQQAAVAPKRAEEDVVTRAKKLLAKNQAPAAQQADAVPAAKKAVVVDPSKAKALVKAAAVPKPAAKFDDYFLNNFLDSYSAAAAA